MIKPEGGAELARHFLALAFTRHCRRAVHIPIPHPSFPVPFTGHSPRAVHTSPPHLQQWREMVPPLATGMGEELTLPLV